MLENTVSVLESTIKISVKMSNLLANSCLVAHCVSASLCIRTNSTDIEGGAITSPNFPNNYPDSVSCTAYIQPSGIRGITIEFLQPFDVKSSFDWLKVI